MNQSDECFTELNPLENLINQHLVHLITDYYKLQGLYFKWCPYPNVPIPPLLVKKPPGIYTPSLTQKHLQLSLHFKIEHVDLGLRLIPFTQIPTHYIKQCDSSWTVLRQAYWPCYCHKDSPEILQKDSHVGKKNPETVKSSHLYLYSSLYILCQSSFTVLNRKTVS